MTGAVLRRGILFDFDDTLVETTVFFDQAKAHFAELMASLGFPAAEALVKLNEFDIKNVLQAGGFLKNCFPQALGETYEYYCQIDGAKPVPEIKKQVEDMGWWVFEQPPELIPGAEDVVKDLAAHYHLVLTTKGDPEVQYDRLDKSGLRKYFATVYVLPDKTDQIYLDILSREGLLRECSWVVGNSMKGDINPAVRIGLNCIHVFHRHTWDFEEEIPLGGHYSVENIKEVPKIIKNGKF